MISIPKFIWVEAITGTHSPQRVNGPIIIVLVPRIIPVLVFPYIQIKFFGEE